MQMLRAFGLVLLSFTVLAFPVFAEPLAEEAKETPKTDTQPRQQQLVEDVRIAGNRRLKDVDLLYYIKTRPGDVYSEAKLQSDLKVLLSLNFFDKTKTRVLTEPGVRGGINVIFQVEEFPIIRDLQFEGSKAVPESDILKAFREKRVGISKESVFDPVKARNGSRVLRELLAQKGYPNATVEIREEEVSATSIAVTYDIDQGNRSRIVDIEFEGNEVFSDGELRGALQLVQETGIVSRFKGQDILNLEKLQYDLQKNVRDYMFSKGYFQARIGEPEVEGLGYKRTGFPILNNFPLPLITSKDDTLRITVPINEGRIFKVGELKVVGNSIFSEQQILSIVGLQKGEVANAKRLRDAVYEDLKKLYGSQGFVLYLAEFDPEFKDNPNKPDEGIVDITITIDEGKQFRLRRLEFVGNTFTRDRVLRREFLINEGDIYNQIALERSVLRLNQLGYFDPVDKDRDVEVRTDEDQGTADTIIRVAERGRQQISFNGGISGIGGTFFGLEYSTNNFLGRGEVLSFNFGIGNQQQTFSATYQQPYFRDRPINVGLTLFAQRYKFLGQGTSLSQNQNLINAAFSPLGTTLVNDENLFTQTTYGANLFVTTQLSEFFFKKSRFTQFSRIGLSYQFAATSIKDPPINATNPTQGIPIIFAQPNITTSRVTGSFVYDTRRGSANGIDTISGKQISAALAFTGLGGDVRSYQPSISYQQYIPVRRKKSEMPEVFAFRIQAGTIGTFGISDSIRNANSFSYIGGIPYNERYFLGGEFDVRGYEARAIVPIVPIENYVTTKNVVVAQNAVGTPIPIAGLTDRDRNALIQIGTLTGASGNNTAFLNRSFFPVGGDTQLLGNFEYRIPIFGPVSIAAFADVGTVFNLRNPGIQEINSNFLPDDTFIGAGTITALSLQKLPGINNFNNLFIRNGVPLSRTEFTQLCGLSLVVCSNAVGQGVEQVFLRGDAQTNQLVRLDQSIFDKFGDFRSSVGLEMRVQVPVVNVPFRLIYFYNPNGKFGFTQEAPGVFLPGRSNGLKFSVGRTF